MRLYASGLAVWLLGATSAPVVTQTPATRTLQFTGAEWTTTDPHARVASLLGEEALQLRTGEIWRRDLQLGDGTIEFDIAAQPVRSFLGVMFRLAEENGRLTYEDIYFRPTASGEWDALQYEPVVQGFGGWQLYHGPGYTASATIPTDRWTHVRIVLSGDTAEVYVDRASAPTLRIPRLQGTRRHGGVGFWSFFPRGEPSTLFTGNFANLIVTPAPRQPAPAPEPSIPVSDTAIRSWRLAEPWAAANPDKAPARRRWTRTVTADPTGLVNLTREFPHSVDDPKLTASALVTIVASRAARAGLRVGFSDELRVMLNGDLLFEGANVFRFGYPPSMGLVRLGDMTVHLPLRAGENELILDVTETEDFGWGFVAELVDPQGLVLR